MEAIVNNLIKAIGWSIFHSLWQGAIIYGVLLMLLAIPGSKARMKHNLAYGALCLIFVLFCVTFFSIFKLPVGNGLKSGTEVTLNAAYYQYMSTVPQQLSSQTENLFPYLVSVYGIGIIFQLFILFAGYKKMLLLKYADRNPVPAEWVAVFQEMVGRLQLRRHISFYLSSKVNVPLVIGYFKPVVLFPIALATQLEIKQLEAILIHELSHIRRNDYLLNLVKTAIETVLFFNPFIWLTGRHINIEREHACDDLVVKLTGTPVTYAHALLKLEILKDKSAPALSMAATGKNQHLYQRIKRITDMKTNYMNAKQQFFAIALTVATVISLAWVKPSKAEKHITNDKATTKTIEVMGVAIKMHEPEAFTSAVQDTTKKKRKFKAVITKDGKKLEYNSLEEMPDSIRESFANRHIYFSGNGANVIVNSDSITKASLAFLSSPEWKKQQEDIVKTSKEVTKYFNSPEWQKQQRDIAKNAAEMSKHFNSPEWKKQQQDIAKNAAEVGKKIGEYYNSPEWKKQMESIAKNGEEINKYFSSPEWQKQQESISINAEEIGKKVGEYYNSPEWKKQMENITKNAKNISIHVNSPEFKKKVEEARKLQNSDEYKALKKKFDAEVQELKKKKGINTDLTPVN